MTEEYDTTDAPEQRSIAKPLLTMAVVLTIAWFAIVAITIMTQKPSAGLSGYGIDDIQSATLVASR
ncbi:MAG: hypothetical protein WBD37_08985 [Anderseniella sp.]